jgi:hypothetical protein
VVRASGARSRSTKCIALMMLMVHRILIGHCYCAKSGLLKVNGAPVEGA